MILLHKAKATLTPVEMFHGDELHYVLVDGRTCILELIDTDAEVMSTTLDKVGVEEPGGMTTIRFWAHVIINGTKHQLIREIGTQNSFYEPWIIDGMRIWLDAVDPIFKFLEETHGPCRLSKSFTRPRRRPKYKQARFAIQDETLRICPEILHPWCPLPEGGIKIEDCFRGEDCWMGAFDGVSAHGGLDINHPKGTPLYAPFDLDFQFMPRTVKQGAVNNSWRGMRRWDVACEWLILSAHMTEVIVAEAEPLKAGTHYAVGAGVWVGEFEHSHFVFSIYELGVQYVLDPWILFWQMYQDQKEKV